MPRPKDSLDADSLNDIYQRFLDIYGDYDSSIQEFTGLLGKHLSDKFNEDDLVNDLKKFIPDP